MKKKIFLYSDQSVGLNVSNTIKKEILSCGKYQLDFLEGNNLQELTKEKVKNSDIIILLIGRESFKTRATQNLIRESLNKGSLSLGVKFYKDMDLDEEGQYFKDLLHMVYDYEKYEGDGLVNWIDSAWNSKEMFDEIIADLIEEKIYK